MKAGSAGRPAARRWAGNLLACAAGAAVALLLGEAAARLLWTGAPPAGAGADTLPLMRVPDPSVLYRLVPGSSGVYSGTQVRINALGLRDREIAVPKPDGVRRILVLGDSMVFGVGVEPESTIPGKLGALMAPAEVINAGVFGYNLAQETSLLEEIGPRVRPDVVVACFVHNDIDNWGLGEAGAVPELRSSRFDPPPPDAWSTRLARLMLPEEFDPGRLNLLPVSSGARAWLASHSRLYLFGYLRLRTHAWNMTSGEQVNPLVAAPTCESREVIWRPLQERYSKLKALTEQLGASLRVVILGGQLWEGAPLRRVHEILRSESIPFLDLTPVWKDRDYYARTYTLGWDPHPNAQANALSAELIAAFLNLPPESASADPYAAIRARPDLAPLIDPWRARQQQAEMAHAAGLVGAAASLPRSVDLAPRSGAAEGGQLLYGFWDSDGGPGLPGGGTGRWIASRGAVLLGWSGAGAEIEIDLQAPPGAAARSRAPRTARVTVSVPPDQCGLVTREFPLDFSMPRQRLTLSVALPGGASGPLEVEVAASPFEAGLLGAAGRDPRLVSLLVSRIASR